MTQPEKIGPFRILETVGRGGMGAVYKAVHEEADEVVALKVLLDSVADDSELRSRFEAEIETLKRLRHPNIVRLYGFGQEEGLLYYAMEYVDGPSLASFLKRGSFFSWEQVVHIGVEVCKALRHAHDRGIIHRDIKPANILLLDNGEVKVSDYGIAHFFGSSRLTTANMVIGTIEFMSPEQAQAGPLTPKSDIYSLGALLYALMTGVPPYIARTLPEILQKYRSGPPDSIRYRRPEVPAVLDMFIMELLRVQPDKRPLDARIVGRRLEAIRVAFSQSPEENPFKDGVQRTQSSRDEDKVADIERQLDNGSYGDIVIGSKKKKGADRSTSASGYSSDNERFFEPFSTSSPGGFSFGNSHEFSTGGMTMAEGRGPQTGDSRYDFPEESDQTAGAVLDSSSGKSALSETGFDLNVSVLEGENAASSCDVLKETSDTGVTDDRKNESVPASSRALQTPAASNVPSDSASITQATPSVTQSLDSNDAAKLADQDFDLNVSPSSGSDTGIGASTSSQYAVYGNTESTSAQPASNSYLPSALEVPTRWTGSLKNSDSSACDVATQIGQAGQTDGANSIDDLDDSVIPLAASSLPAGTGRSRSKKKRLDPSTSSHRDRDRGLAGSSIGKSGSRPGGNTAESTGGYVTKTSHFTVIDERELGRFAPEPESNSYYVSLKIWVFSIILICVGFLFWYSLRSPSADTLYQRIASRLDDSDGNEYLSALRSVERECRSFVTLYPNDTRVEEIQGFLSELDLGNLERRLERQIERKSKDSSLSPVERAYIEAIYQVKNEPERGIVKLKAFVEIFSSEEQEGKKSPKAEQDAEQSLKKQTLYDRTVNGQCVILAKRRLKQAMHDFEKSKTSEISLLEGRLEYADSLEEVDPQRANTIRRAIIDFYGDQHWAKPILNQAQAKLDKTKVDELKVDKVKLDKAKVEMKKEPKK